MFEICFAMFDVSMNSQPHSKSIVSSNAAHAHWPGEERFVVQARETADRVFDLKMFSYRNGAI
jgi:hypothetical protein